MRRAFALGRDGFLERALILTDQAEARCPQLRVGNAKLRADWIIDGQMTIAARRWAGEIAHADRSVEEREQSARALGAMTSAESPDDLLKAGDDARANGDVRLARRFYTRAISALERDGSELVFERRAHDVPLWPEKRWVWAFSPKNGFFVEGREGPYHSAETLTLWSLQRAGAWMYHLADLGGIESAAVSSKGTVLLRTRTANLLEWDPFANETRNLGFPPRGVWMSAARSHEIPAAFSTDGSFVALDTFLHRFGADHVLLARKDAVAFSISPDDTRLTVASATELAGFAAPTNTASSKSATDAWDPPSLEPLWRFPIDPPLAIDAKEQRDVAISHDGKWLVTRDARGLTLYAIDETKGLTMVKTAKPIVPIAAAPGGPSAGGGVQFSESDRWLLVKKYREDRVFPFAAFESASCIRGLEDSLGFTTIAGREWVVTGTAPPAGTPFPNPRWRLTGLPLDPARCDEPTPVLEISHLDDELEHGREALELIARMPCDGSIVCPASGARTQVEVRWPKRWTDREQWMSERYGCRVGDRALPWSICALRFETEDVIWQLTATAASGGPK